jgi:hypothetical protein
MAPTLIIIGLLLFAIFGRGLISAAVDALFDSGHEAITNGRSNHRRSSAQLITSLSPGAAIVALRSMPEVADGSDVQVAGLQATITVLAVGTASVTATPNGSGALMSVTATVATSAEHTVRPRSAVLAALRTANSRARLK